MSLALHFAAVLTIATGVLTGCERSTPVTLTGATMGTTWSVQIVALPENVSATTLERDITVLLEHVNALMSTYRDDSELMTFNATPSTDWVGVSRELQSVIDEAQEIATLTEGAFDVTVGPLVNLWGFGPAFDAQRIPTAGEIDAAARQVGFRSLQSRSEPPALRKMRADMFVDLSAIAKGHAVDAVAVFLEDAGVNAYLVEIGGELRARGSSPRDRDWTVAVEQPVTTDRRVQRVLPLRDRAIATSGDYRNFFELDGRLYSHAIDPRTGYPVNHDLASVTVLEQTAMRADALATALLVLGADAGYEFALKHRIPAFFVTRNGDVFDERSTPEFERLTAVDG